MASSTEEEAGEDLDEEAAEDDESQDNYDRRSQFSIFQRSRELLFLLSQTGEMGDFATSFVRFLSWSSDLPMRASLSLANLRFARRCCGVWACVNH